MTGDPHDLRRFLDAQDEAGTYEPKAIARELNAVGMTLVQTAGMDHFFRRA